MSTLSTLTDVSALDMDGDVLLSTSPLITCPEQSFNSFYKLWRVQGFFNLVVTRLTPFFQTLVLYLLISFVVFVDYSLLFDATMTTLTPDGAVPSFFDFFSFDSPIKHVLFCALTLLTSLIFAYRIYKLSQLFRNKPLKIARTFYNDRNIAQFGSDWEHVLSFLRVQPAALDDAPQDTNNPVATHTSTLIISSGSFLSSRQDSPRHDASRQDSPRHDPPADDDSSMTSSGVSLSTVSENPDKTPRSPTFTERCCMRYNFMSCFYDNYENQLRSASSNYLAHIVKDIYFPDRDWDFYVALVDPAHQSHKVVELEWERRVKERRRFYKRQHLFPFVLVTFLYHAFLLMLRFFPLLLNPSSVTEPRLSTYARNILRPANSLPHESEMLFKKVQKAFEEIIALTPLNLLLVYIMRNIRNILAVLLIVCFTLNLRSEFQLFGISSGVITNLLLTIVLFSYSSSTRVVFDQSLNSAFEKLYSLLPRLNTVLPKTLVQKDRIDFIRDYCYAPTYSLLLSELTAPFRVRPFLRDEQNFFVRDNVIQTVISHTYNTQ